MSRKRPKDRKTRQKSKPTEDGAFTFLGNKKTVASVVAVAIILSLVIGGIYINYRVGPGDGHNTFIDREIFFPGDEGWHEEPYEGLTIVLHLTSATGISMTTSVTYTSMEGEISKSSTVTDTHAATGENYWTAIISEGALSTSSDGMGINWSNGQQSDSFYAVKGLGQNDPNSIYSYSMGYWEDSVKILGLDCTIYNRKTPVLYGSDGKMYFYELGTLYGYFQPRVSVRGNLTLGDGSVHRVDGYGWIDHTWGYYLLSDMEILHIQLRDDVDIRIIRAYIAGSNTPGLEYYYYIRPDGSFDITQWQPETAASLSVSTDGSYSGIETVEYYFYPMKFEKAPWDQHQMSSFAVQWRFLSEYHDMDFLIGATFPQQFTTFGTWAGSVTPYNVQSTLGRGYALLNHRYTSNPEINDVRDNRARLELPHDPTEVRANITNDIPYEYIKLLYRIDGGEENSVGMQPEETEANVWKGSIPGQKLMTVVDYKIVVLDLAGSEVESDWETYTVRVE